jgi:hypothetical protein
VFSNIVLLGKIEGGLIYQVLTFTYWMLNEVPPLLVNQPMGKGHPWFSGSFGEKTTPSLPAKVRVVRPIRKAPENATSFAAPGRGGTSKT